MEKPEKDKHLEQKKTNYINITFNIVIISLIIFLAIALIILWKLRQPSEGIKKPEKSQQTRQEMQTNQEIEIDPGIPTNYIKKEAGLPVENNLPEVKTGLPERKTEIPEVFVLTATKVAHGENNKHKKNIRTYDFKNYLNKFIDEKGNIKKDAISKIFRDCAETLKQIQRENQHVKTEPGNAAEGLVDNLINNMLPGLSGFYGNMADLMDREEEIRAQLQEKYGYNQQSQTVNNDIIMIPANENIRQQLKQIKDYNSVSYKGYLRKETDIVNPEKSVLIFYVTEIVHEPPRQNVSSGSAGS